MQEQEALTLFVLLSLYMPQGRCVWRVWPSVCLFLCALWILGGCPCVRLGMTLPVCVLELCVSLGGGHGCGGVWACFSVVLPVFFCLCVDVCEHLGEDTGA